VAPVPVSGDEVSVGAYSVGRALGDSNGSGSLGLAVAVSVTSTGVSVTVGSGGGDVEVAVGSGVCVAVGDRVGVAVGEGVDVAVGSSAVPRMRVNGAEAKPPALPTASMLYLPTVPSGTRNVADAVPVLEAMMFLATVRDDPGAVRKRSVITSPAANPRTTALIC
jgi:hypothetical protein